MITDPDNPVTPWRYYPTHNPSRGFRHTNEGGNAAMNDGRVEFLDPQQLTLTNSNLPPDFVNGTATYENSLWVWWSFKDDGVSRMKGCTCGDKK